MVDVQTFIGLENARRTIDAIIAGHSPIHAVLLYGATGAGKTLLADRLAKFWLCLNPQPTGACGACGPCRSFDEDRAVDFQRIEPFGPSRQIKQGMIVYDPKETWPGIPVLTYFRTHPLMSPHKVVLFEEADRMNGAAANALLKTLEEPGAHARLILTTSAISQILPTILSRCVAIACELPLDSEVEERLGPIAEYERVFSEGAPGLVERVRSKAKHYAALWDELEKLPSLHRGGAILASERFRDSADKLGDAMDQGARAGHSEALRCLALWVAERMPQRPHALLATIETHRRVTGNVNFGLSCDALFAAILT